MEDQVLLEGRGSLEVDAVDFGVRGFFEERRELGAELGERVSFGEGWPGRVCFCVYRFRFGGLFFYWCRGCCCCSRSRVRLCGRRLLRHLDAKGMMNETIGFSLTPVQITGSAP